MAIYRQLSYDFDDQALALHPAHLQEVTEGPPVVHDAYGFANQVDITKLIVDLEEYSITQRSAKRNNSATMEHSTPSIHSARMFMHRASPTYEKFLVPDWEKSLGLVHKGVSSFNCRIYNTATNVLIFLAGVRMAYGTGAGPQQYFLP